MRHIVSISGGTASAVAADRVLKRYGADAVTLWFADTLWEDEGLYTFLDNLETYWNKEIIRYQDGRTPLQVAEANSIIPNQKHAPCSRELKAYPFRRFIKDLPKPLTVHLGFDWTEQHRLARPRKEYEAIDGVSVDVPLMWQPIAWLPHRNEVASWGVPIPRLYDLGFPHNNCGGRCVKQGLAEWFRLKATMPERFEEVAQWEQAQRAKGGARASYAIARDQADGKVVPLPLRDIESKRMAVLMEPSGEDKFACMCAY